MPHYFLSLMLQCTSVLFSVVCVPNRVSVRQLDFSSVFPLDISLMNEIVRAYSVAGETKRAEDVSNLHRQIISSYEEEFLSCVCVQLLVQLS
jgi:hypothetical protein